MPARANSVLPVRQGHGPQVRKDRRLSIRRLSSKELETIQKRALAEGPSLYETVIASLIHKYATGGSKKSEQWLSRFGKAATNHRRGPEIHDYRPLLYWSLGWVGCRMMVFGPVWAHAWGQRSASVVSLFCGLTLS
jgi:hypothetical protein